MENIEMKSNKQIGEEIILDFKQDTKDIKMTIIGVKFTDYGKVLYDIKVEYPNEGGIGYMREVDSYYITEKPGRAK